MKKGGKPEKHGGNDLRQRDVVEAVVFVDDFEHGFCPVSNKRCPALIPLANIPMIEYTLDLLETNNVEQVYLFCSSMHASELETYLSQSSRWSANDKMNVAVRSGTGWDCAGDVLRELDSCNLIRSDSFILLTGMVASNANISAIHAEFKAARQADRNNVMMCVFRKVLPGHYARKRSEDIVVAIEPQTRSITQYLNVPQTIGKESSRVSEPVTLIKGATPEASGFFLPLSMVDSAGEVELHRDLMDTRMYMCSKEIAALMTENFDYRSLQGDLIRGVLTSDVLGHHILAHVDDTKYIAPIACWRDLHVVTKDLSGRWLYPLTLTAMQRGRSCRMMDSPMSDTVTRPTINHVESMLFSTPLSDSRRMKMRAGASVPVNNGGTLYCDRSVNMPRDCVVVGDSVIGTRVLIGSNVRIVNSVIGANVIIDDHVVIENSHVWDGCVIKQGAHIKDSIICDGCTVAEDCHISSGCVVGSHVHVAADLEPATRLYIPRPTSDSIDDEEDISLTEPYKEKAVVWLGCPPPEGFAAHSVSTSMVKSKSGQVKVLSRDDMWYLLNASDEGRIVDVPNDNPMTADEEREVEGDADLAVHVEEEEEEEEENGEGDAGDQATARDKFMSAALTTLEKRLQEKTDIDTIALELNALKMRSNSSIQDVAAAVMEGLLDSVDTEALGGDTKKILVAVKKTLKTWNKLITKFVSNVEDQVELLYSLEELVSEKLKDPYMKMFRFLLQLLYDMEFVSEKAIFTWADTNTAENQLLKQAQPFLDWLKEAEEESEED